MAEHTFNIFRWEHITHEYISSNMHKGLKVYCYVGNKAKARISNRVLQENEARQIF